MPKHPIPKISPLIQKWHPHATAEEQELYTGQLRSFLLIAYRIFERLDEEGFFNDSPESESNATVESVNPPDL